MTWRTERKAARKAARQRERRRERRMNRVIDEWFGLKRLPSMDVQFPSMDAQYLVNIFTPYVADEAALAKWAFSAPMGKQE